MRHVRGVTTWSGSVRIVLSLVVAACGSPPVEPVAAPLPAPPPAVAATPPAPPRRELAVPAPEDLSFVARVADMDRLRGELVGAFPRFAAMAGGASDLPALLDVVVGRDAAAVIDPSFEMDFASMKNDRSVVVSFGARPDAEAKLAHRIDGADDRGLVMLGPDKGGRSAFRTCALVPASKPATRLVCSDDEGALRDAALYLSRAVPAEPLDADLRLSVTKSLLQSRSTRAASTILAGLTRAFEKELERIDFDLKLRADLEIAATLRLSSRSSAIARAFVPRSTPAPPPPAFYRLPRDSVLAAHFAGAAADDLKPLRDALGADFVEAVKQDGYTDEAARAFADQASQLFLTGGPLVVASGIGASGVAGVEKAFAGASTPKDDAKAAAALAPWTLVWVDEPATRWTTGTKRLIAIAEAAEKSRDKKVAQRAPPKDPDGSHTTLRLAPKVDPRWKLPEGSLEVLVDRAPRADKSKTKTSRLFVVPKGTGTWFGYGEDAALVASRLRLVIDDNATSGTIAEVPEAAALRAKPSLAAATLVPLGALLGVKDASSPHRVRRTLEAAARMTSKGHDVLAFTASSEVLADAARLRLTTTIPRRALVDFVTAALGP